MMTTKKPLPDCKCGHLWAHHNSGGGVCCVVDCGCGKYERPRSCIEAAFDDAERRESQWPKYSRNPLNDVREAIGRMRWRMEQPGGHPGQAGCRLSLKMSEFLLERLDLAEKVRDQMEARLESTAAEIDAMADKAIAYDLDQAGIDQRTADAAELVELRATNARLSKKLKKATRFVINHYSALPSEPPDESAG